MEVTDAQWANCASPMAPASFTPGSHSRADQRARDGPMRRQAGHPAGPPPMPVCGSREVSPSATKQPMSDSSTRSVPSSSSPLAASRVRGSPWGHEPGIAAARHRRSPRPLPRRPHRGDGERPGPAGARHRPQGSRGRGSPAGQCPGDGTHTIEQLIERQSRRRAAATGGESRIPIDGSTADTVAEAGWSMDDVLPEGQELTVRRTANLHTGGPSTTSSDLHPALAEASVAASRALAIPVTGIDLLVTAPDQPDYVIIEANERPGLANHEPQPTVERFMDLLFPTTASPTHRPVHRIDLTRRPGDVCLPRAGDTVRGCDPVGDRPRLSAPGAPGTPGHSQPDRADRPCPAIRR